MLHKFPKKEILFFGKIENVLHKFSRKGKFFADHLILAGIISWAKIKSLFNFKKSDKKQKKFDNSKENS